MMNSKLNRDQILNELLRTLVLGWGFAPVSHALQELQRNNDWTSPSPKSKKATQKDDSQAEKMLEVAILPDHTKEMIVEFARNYDRKLAFPKLSDAKSFLISHHENPKDVKNRNQAFSRMIPLITKMSEKGLARLISYSRHSGPARLDAISDAIKDAGANYRGQLTDSRNNEGVDPPAKPSEAE